jgi:hypothetical protein
MKNKFKDLLDLHRKEYKTWESIYLPLLGGDVSFNMRGFKHLRFHANNEVRNSREIIHKLTLLPFVHVVLQNATEIENYRQLNGIEYWSFVATPKESDRPIRVIVRRVGNGTLHFWSVMGLRT